MPNPPEVTIGLKSDGEQLTTAITLVAPLEFTLPPREPIWLLKRRFTVPCGFTSDGASVPRFFWRLLSPPIDPVTLAPSIIHDWLYTQGGIRDLTRLECDRWYRNALIANGYPRWKANITYVGIRLFGWRHWGARWACPPSVGIPSHITINLKKHGEIGNGRPE